MSGCAIWRAVGGRPRRPDARPPPDRQVPAAPRDLLPRPRRGVDGRAPRVAGRRCASRTPPARRRSPTTCTPTTRSLARRDDAGPRDRRDRAPSAVGGDRSRGCGACTASTRCRRSGCAPRSATSQRFTEPTALSAPTSALVPSEHTSATSAARARSPRPAPTHARRLLVEAAHHYRRPPRIGGALLTRQDGAEAWVVDLSWRAQRRLHGRWQHLRSDRRKPNGVAAIAVARELAHFCWELPYHRLTRHTALAGCRGAAPPGPPRKPFATEL